MANEGYWSVGSTKFTEGIAWGKTERHGRYQLGRDKREGWTIDSHMSLKWGDASYLGSGDCEADMRQIGESIYVKYVDEQIVREATTI